MAPMPSPSSDELVRASLPNSISINTKTPSTTTVTSTTTKQQRTQRQPYHGFSSTSPSSLSPLGFSPLSLSNSRCLCFESWFSNSIRVCLAFKIFFKKKQFAYEKLL
ncbi:hypothetical protein Scep_027767 [Stephania cephalantha]|uniref:Uncharacterized protein n=1 Tax=Stephania cephalantha TaxID=152367 RepID=A0AAP0EAW4_9MAGN